MTSASTIAELNASHCGELIGGFNLAECPEDCDTGIMEQIFDGGPTDTLVKRDAGA